MLFERIYEQGLAQASYFIGCQASGEAIVIDPKRDIDEKHVQPHETENGPRPHHEKHEAGPERNDADGGHENQKAARPQ